MELARQADECIIMGRARRLAAWVGSGRPVTAKGVLRPADATEAGKAIGIAVPARVRTAADVEALHHAWLVAQAAGWLVVDANRAMAGPGTDDGPLPVWLAGLDAVLRAESHDRRRRGAAVACRAVLTVLADDPPPPTRDEVAHAARHLLGDYDLDEFSAAFQAFPRGLAPMEAALAVLADFGAVDGGTHLTPLGRWAAEQLRARAGEPVTPDLPADALLTRLATVGEDDAWALAARWRGERPDAEAATQLLRAAATATPAERVAAVNIVASMGDEAVPAWRDALKLPEVAPHARAVLAAWRLCPEPDDAQRRWLVVEYALVVLARDGIEAAYHDVSEHGGLDALQQPSGHPGESSLREAVAGFVAAGLRPRVFQLKIALTRVRPPVWRRVLMPASATLGDLHDVIQVVMDWDDDHLHSFTSEEGRYCDPYYELDDCDDEDAVRLSRVLPRAGATLTYVYDFGDWWEHTITLEKIVDASESVTYPTCLTGRGDAPVEDWTPDDPEEPTPFDRDDINRRLAALA